MSRSMSIFTVNGAPIFDYRLVRNALLKVYSPSEVSNVMTSDSPLASSWVKVTPASEPPFSVRVDPDGSSCGADGLFDQNARFASALRAELPADAPRIVAAIADDETFIDLVDGVTPHDIEWGMRSLDEFDEV